jgi:phytoene synthase
MDEIATFARERIEKGSKSFAMAARLFDGDMRASVYMLYAWCRRCDDEIDGQELGFAAAGPAPPIARRLAAIEEKTRAALAGEACEPEFIALARVMRRHGIPDWLPLEHLQGFAMDAAATSYRSLDDTLKYCWHVAGAVGVMMAMVMGARDRDVLLRACDLGVAFQLTNIARDVVADAASGRVYLPADWLAAEALSPRDVADPECRAAVHRVTTRLLAVADDYYRSATHGLAALPPRAALAIGAARSVYRSIGCLVRRRGAAAWDRRAIVGPAGKAGAVVSGAGLALWARIAACLGPAPERPKLYSPAALDRL